MINHKAFTSTAHEQRADFFYEAVWQARNRMHMILIKLLILIGLRNVRGGEERSQHRRVLERTR